MTVSELLPAKPLTVTKSPVEMNTTHKPLKILLERKGALENELKTLPEGTLYCSRRKDWWVYYQLLPKKGNRKKEKRFGISRDTEKIFGLVRKRYITKALGRIDKDIKVVEMALRHYVDIDEASVMAKSLTP